MLSRSWVACVLLTLLVFAGLSGCFPFPGGSLDEDRDPNVIKGRARKATYDYDGAIAAFEKALDENLRCATAHYELGLIYYQNVSDYAAAIYHFQRLLKLRPDWKQAQTIRQFIEVSKIELAKTAPLGPQTPHLVRELENITAKQHALTREDAQLRTNLLILTSERDQLRAENAQLRLRLGTLPEPLASNGVAFRRPMPGNGAPVTNATAPSLAGTASVQAATAPPLVASNALARPASPGGSPAPVGTAALTGARRPLSTATPAAKAPAATRRTHTVQAGETLAAIGRRYGLNVEDIRAVNPGLNPQRLKAGQVLRLPSR